MLIVEGAEMESRCWPANLVAACESLRSRSPQPLVSCRSWRRVLATVASDLSQIDQRALPFVVTKTEEGRTAG
jgi:hypothetical protein